MAVSTTILIIKFFIFLFQGAKVYVFVGFVVIVDLVVLFVIVD